MGFFRSWCAFLAALGLWCMALPAAAQTPVTVDEVRVEGNRRSDADAILGQISTRAGTPLSRRGIREDIERIFLNGYYTDIQVDLSEKDGKTIVTFIVAEKPSIRKVVYFGNEQVNDEDLAEVVDLREFGILDLAKVARNAEKLKDLYVEKGYFLAEVDYRVDPLENNEVDVVFAIVEKEEVKVESVVIVGNSALSDDFIKERIETREGNAMSFLTGAGSFKQEAFDRDMLRIAQFYYDQGYIKSRVGTPKIELSADKSKLFLTVPVEEGDRFRTGEVDIMGDFIDEKDALMKFVTMKEGEWFSSTKLRESITKLGERYKDEGYAYVNLVPNTGVDEDARAVAITIDIDKGEKVRIGRIQVVGNTKTRDKVIRREMRVYEGEYYSASGLRRSEQLVTRLGYFETVAVRTARGADEKTMDVIVEVKEKATGTFQVGAGFSSIESFVAQAQISENNVFGRGQTLSLQATLSSVRSIANLRFADDYFMDSKVRFASNIYRFETNYEDFTKRSLGGDLTLGHPLGDDWGISGTYTLEEVSVRAGGFGDSDTGRVANLYGNGITSSLRFRLYHDTRNNRLFPSAGVYASGSVEHAPDWLLSENEFTRYRLQGRYYYGLGLGLTARINATYGLIGSPNPVGVPIFERFFVGGPLTVRGFRRHTLGPKIDVPSSGLVDSGTEQLNIGGTEQFFVNLEIEYPVFQAVGIRGVFFIDTGNAFDRADSFDEKLDQMRSAWGFGIRWFSPIGPLRFEWGFPFDPQGIEESSVFDFSIGNFF